MQMSLHVSLYWMIDVIHPINNFFFCYWAMLIPIIAIQPLAGIFCRSHSTGQNTGHYATDNFKNKTGGVS